jgi:PAS domain S-box-containing protein
MKDADKTREQLLYDLSEARQRIAQLESLAAGTTRAGVTVEESKTRFRTLFESATEGILAVDIVTRTVVFCNASAANILGYLEFELTGMNLESLYPQDAVKSGLAEFAAQANGLSTAATALPFQRQDGTRIYVDMTATQGLIAGSECVISFLRDVTERRLAEDRLAAALEQLRRSHDDLLTILGRLRLVSAIIDGSGALAYLSPLGLEMLDAEAVDVLGRPWAEVLPLPPRDRGNVELMAAQPCERRTRVPVSMEGPDRRVYWMDVEVHDDPGEPGRRILFLYDMTEVRLLRDELEKSGVFQKLLGSSPAMGTLFHEIDQVSRVDWTVLIEGETGTGKELVARAVHDRSARGEKPFVPVNCAGLTDSILGSQLFGHKRGSFTGAVSDEKGVFEAGNGGTVFLDEIGDISPMVQTSLLRVLETKEVTRIGESMPRKVDVRIVAATNRDLQKEVSEGRFRDDLYYRVRSARILVPPLRVRRGDVPVLAAEFLARSCRSSGKKVEAISHDAMRCLLEYSWPGNVRELKSAIEFAVLRSMQRFLSRDDLPPEVRQPAGTDLAGAPPPEVERERILDALAKSRGNRTLAARMLGMSRATFYRYLDRLGISTTSQA